VDLMIISFKCLLNALEFLSLIINVQMKSFLKPPRSKAPNI
jgi:hypothetical protein